MLPTSLLPLLSIPVLLGTTVSALGINCRGSGMCTFVHCGGRDCVGQMSDLAFSIPDNATYAPGQKIVCSPVQKLGAGICMFTENYGPATGVEVKAAYEYIMRWGCAKCGSAPFDRAANDVGKGSLTLNVVHKPGCKGICSVSSSMSSSTMASTSVPSTFSTVVPTQQPLAPAGGAAAPGGTS